MCAGRKAGSQVGGCSGLRTVLDRWQVTQASKAVLQMHGQTRCGGRCLGCNRSKEVDGVGERAWRRVMKVKPVEWIANASSTQPRSHYPAMRWAAALWEATVTPMDKQ